MSPISRLLNLFTRRRRARLVERIGMELARDCLARVWDRVHRKTLGMSLAQMRGYVRAHTGAIVGAGAELAASRHGLDRRMLAEVVARTTEELIDLIVQGLLNATLYGRDRALAA